MIRAAALATLAAAGGPGHGAHAAEPVVSIGYATYTPRHLEIVTGETVTWTQDSVRRHTVTALDGSFDSGSLAQGDRWAHAFDAKGSQPYYCRLHAGITGEVSVHDAVLDAQHTAAAKGRPFPLTGRASAGTRTVEVRGDDGSVTEASVEPEGRFTATVTPRSTTTYRVGDSTPVTLRVLDRRVGVRVLRRPDRRWSVVTSVSPASPRATVVLQLRLRERFGWWPVAHGRLGRDSTTTLRARRVRRVRARVVLTLPDRATPLAVSRTFHLGLPAPHAHAGRS